mmetsp:Transcript_2787/g.3192  ORF Transcript_2787/g.3192 Transcript_2787/m.3192 type:complete len:109 (-) Transcript_2787:208-534(-)
MSYLLVFISLLTMIMMIMMGMKMEVCTPPNILITTDLVVTFGCHVVKRDDTNNTYVVKLLFEDSTAKCLTDYPRESISFVLKAYQSDEHLMGVFRSHIGLPDYIFPEH